MRICFIAGIALVFASRLAFSAPNTPALNPDVRQETIGETICVSGYTRSVRPATSYTNGVKKKLLRERGLPIADAAHYELDHIVPLALGGHPRALGNLMLQPWQGSEGARRKDRLEVKLQCLVCNGQVRLDEAQWRIYSDWQAADARYTRSKCSRGSARKFAGRSGASALRHGAS